MDQGKAGNDAGVEKRKRIFLQIQQVLFPLILLLYPLRHILVGAEWWDTGYNYGNFMYMDHMDPMWMFSTYLATALGRFFTKLPFGSYMVGLNVYTGLIMSLLALGGYWFFRKKIGMPPWLVFGGELLAISLCWCPTALLYNYLTYLLFGTGVLCLYFGLTSLNRKREMCLLLLAGVSLGVNVFVRFSNLPQMALILAVWVYELLQHHKMRELLRKTGYCLLGYVLGLGIVLGYISLRYGLGTYVGAIERLLLMPQEASSYTLTSMIQAQIQNYHQNLIWLGLPAVLGAVGTLFFGLVPKKLRKWGILSFAAAVMALFYYLMQHNMFNVKYSTKMSMFQWGVCLLTLTWLVCLIQIFHPKVKPKEKLIPGLCLLIVLISPLGTNNHLYTAINNLFLVAPYTLWQLVRFFRFSWEKRRGWFTFNLLGVKVVLGCMLLVIFVQSLLFGWVYVFSEGDGGENLHTSIQNNAILKGIYTSPDRAAVLSSLSGYVKDHQLIGQELILYGQIPALSYYLQMPFAITSWPDLPSYQVMVMEGDLEKLAQEIAADKKQFPGVLLEIRYGAYVLKGAEGVLEQGLSEDILEKMEADPKFELLREWLISYGYEAVFQNEKFVLFLPPKLLEN
jgi:hypothetical protein